MDIRILRIHIGKNISQECLEITEKEKSALINSLVDGGNSDIAAEIESFTPWPAA